MHIKLGYGSYRKFARFYVSIQLAENGIEFVSNSFYDVVFLSKV